MILLLSKVPNGHRTPIQCSEMVHNTYFHRCECIYSHLEHGASGRASWTTYAATTCIISSPTGCMGPYAHLLQPPTLRRAKARTPGRPNLSSICALLWSVRVWPTPRSDTTFHRLSMAGATRRPLRWHQRTAVPSGAVGRCGSASARQAHIVGILRGASRARRAQGAGVRLRGWTYLQAPR